MAPLLQVENLVTRFYTEDGVIHAVNSISYIVDKGESLALVGESGSGKTVSVLSLTGLIPSPPDLIEDGRTYFQSLTL